MSGLNEVNLVQLLQQVSDAKNAGTELQKLSEQQLKQWETQPGFHFLVQSVYLDLSNPLQIRWLAVIQFKNGIEKYWRNTRVNAIGKDEKASIRARLFDLVDEQNNQLCIQNGQATARIARLDFPAEWPNLFEQMESLLGDSNVLQNSVKLFNILMHLNQIIKLLGSARIGRCKPAMQSKVPLIFPLLVRIYFNHFNVWILQSEVKNDEFMGSVQVSYLALKVLRRIVVEGYDRPEKDESVVEFMKLSTTHFDMLLSRYEDYKKMDFYEKFIKCHGKLYYNLITNSPACFILLPSSTDILVSYTKILFNKASEVYNENADVTGDFWEQTAIRGLLILKRAINFVHKKGVITLKSRSDKASIDASINKITTEFLNETLIKKLVDTLMDFYLKLRPSELENWFADPEEWINEQMTTTYEYQIRPCAENFFQDLVNSFAELLAPYLLNKIENDAANISNNLAGFLTKDTIYASFQLSASAVCDLVDFDTLLRQVFLPEAVSTSSSPDQLKIIRRRISLIINEWCTVKCSEESKKLCYEFFSNLLKSESDKVVLLTIVQSLRTMVDDWNFNKDTFQPFIKDIVSLLLQRVLPSVSLTETRLYVLNTLSDIIIQTKPLVSSELLIEILRIVPDLWELSTNNPSEAILSNGILRLLKHLVMSLGEESYLTWDIAIPVVSLSCDPSTAQYQLLNEDGYELWSHLLQNFASSKANLNEKFVKLLPFLEYGVETHTEILPTLLEIVKSYSLVLRPQQFFACKEFSSIFAKLAKYLLQLRDDSFFLILEIWEILTLSNETDHENVLLRYFYDNNILTSLLDSVLLEERPSNYQCSQIIQIAARIAYVNPDALMTFFKSYHRSMVTSVENLQLAVAQRKSVTSDMSFEQFMDKLMLVWMTCFKELFDPKFKKLHLLGLSSLLRTGEITVLNNFANIVTLWIEMLEEINETNDGDCEKYHLNDIVTEQSLEFHPLMPEQIAQHELSKNNDPVHNISLKQFIVQILQFLETNMNSDGYQQLLATVDPKLMENLQIFLSIQP